MIIKSESQVTTSINLTLTEIEAQALIALVGYGTKAFLEIFYKYLGTHYLKPHEKGIISLFETIKKELPGHIYNVEKARGLLRNNNKQL